MQVIWKRVKYTTRTLQKYATYRQNACCTVATPCLTAGVTAADTSIELFLHFAVVASKLLERTENHGDFASLGSQLEIGLR